MKKIRVTNGEPYFQKITAGAIDNFKPTREGGGDYSRWAITYL